MADLIQLNKVFELAQYEKDFSSVLKSLGACYILISLVFNEMISLGSNTTVRLEIKKELQFLCLVPHSFATLRFPFELIKVIF